MIASAWLLFALAVLLGSYVQTVAGFAMGMIIMAVGGASGAVSLPVLAAVVSLVSALNIVLSLRGHVNEVRPRLFLLMGMAQLPAIALGVFWHERLNAEALWLLELLLGLFITVAALSMSMRPAQRSDLSTPAACIAAGFLGGLIGGLFAASGPIIGWFVYRQPLPLAVVRATLLAAFGLSTVVRTLVVGVSGGLTAEVWRLVLLALPLVWLGAACGRRWRPPLGERGMRRAVFVMLTLVGLFIVVRVAWPAITHMFR